MGADQDRMKKDPDLLGGLMETFVAGEVRKLLGLSQDRARLSHYRTLPGQEVDFLLERTDRRVVGLEVKPGLPAERLQGPPGPLRDAGGCLASRGRALHGRRDPSLWPQDVGGADSGAVEPGR
ncbi:DUF4143 domain-containing protein [Geothrix fuzhouensis]|uniref:DUF4143 domain-containing protein n=1 Tax=Geothrix fuzhouensis TaxID=2966451 RepID=UPI00352C151E